MSRRWNRAALPVSCGLCGSEIRRGDALLEIAAASWRVVRCESCAGEPIPNDLPAEHQRDMPALRPKVGLGPLANMAAKFQRDWKQKRAGD